MVIDPGGTVKKRRRHSAEDISPRKRGSRPAPLALAAKLEGGVPARLGIVGWRASGGLLYALAGSSKAMLVRWLQIC
jgi:hypothetical protein